jgi:hypothetical protein
MAIVGTANASHSAIMSPSAQPLPQCSVPLATMIGQGGDMPGIFESAAPFFARFDGWPTSRP